MESEGNSQLLSAQVTLSNKLGMHARAAALFAKTASKYRSGVWLMKDAREVNGKSIMGILTLIAPRGTVLTIRAEGEDAGPALEELTRLVENRFGEE